jgi:hypothetical protein
VLDDLKVYQRITTQLERIARQQHVNRVAAGVQVPGDYVAVSAIVPLATANNNLAGDTQLG